jgi:hypothetical protein
MSTLGANKDYRNGRKNNWRRWTWNNVRERLHPTVRDSPILYLPGPEDLDRAVALSKGIHPDNLIAVDTCLRNVKRVRAGGGLAIHADIHDVIRAWPDHVLVAAVLLDYCHGLEDHLITAMEWMQRPPYMFAPVAVNLRRGQDRSSRAVRIDLRNFVRHYQLELISNGRYLDVTKNRAALYGLIFAMQVMLFTYGEDGIKAFHPIRTAEARTFAKRFSDIIQSLNAVSFTYRSASTNYYDSLIYDNTQYRRSIPGTLDVEEMTRRYQSVNQFRDPPKQEIVRKIAATLAHRTRRRHA